MNLEISKIRESKSAAYIAPLVTFLLLQSLAGLASEEEGAPWWRATPEHWVYPLQTVVAIALLAFWWKQYQFKPFSGFGLATLLGCIGIAVWIAPVALGWQERKEGFDPTLFEDQPALFAFVVLMRFIRLVIVASFIEEIFWRGFLQRYLVNRYEDFWTIPMGTFTWPSVLITTAGVILVHSYPDWPAAAVWGSLVAFCYIKTKTLTACIVMHAVANLILGIYIMQTQNWGLW